jgi:hypothetical protein
VTYLAPALALAHSGRFQSQATEIAFARDGSAGAVHHPPSSLTEIAVLQPLVLGSGMWGDG